MSDNRINLNADMGESYDCWVRGDDGALVPYVNSIHVVIGEVLLTGAPAPKLVSAAFVRRMRIGKLNERNEKWRST